MPARPVNTDGAIQAVLEANQLLTGLHPDPHQALEFVLPYSECQEFTTPDRIRPDDRDEVIRITRSLVCAMIADCHLAMEDVRTAAEWYRRASQSCKAGGYPAVYANMVLEHWLDDHYENALECLRFRREQWRSRPLLVRLYWHVVSGWWFRPWRYAEARRTFLRQRELEKQLEDRLSHRPGR